MIKFHGFVAKEVYLSPKKERSIRKYGKYGKYEGFNWYNIRRWELTRYPVTVPVAGELEAAVHHVQGHVEAGPLLLRQAGRRGRQEARQALAGRGHVVTAGKNNLTSDNLQENGIKSALSHSPMDTFTTCYPTTWHGQLATSTGWSYSI